MLRNQFELLSSRRFLPLFITQFFGAFNDTTFKSALTLLIAYPLSDSSATAHPQIMITVVAALFILPFLLFSASAGQIADKFEKAGLVRIIKFVEIIIMAFASIAFYSQNIYMLMCLLFLMGAQSTFFGPIKYSILPESLETDELIGGNALIEAATFLAILGGTIFGGVAVGVQHGIPIIIVCTMLFAVAGWLSSLFIPATGAAASNLEINPNIIGETWNIMKYVSQRKELFLSVLGISWFWLFGSTVLAQFPSFTKDVLGANENIVTLALSIFSIGIGGGSLVCNWLLDGEVNAKFVPLGVLGMTLFTIDLYFGSHYYHANYVGDTVITLSMFLGTLSSWRIIFDLFFMAVCSGVFIVPLYAILQQKSPKNCRSRVIASNTVFNSLFMVVSAVFITIMLFFNVTIPKIFLLLGILNGCVAVYICKLLPEVLIKSFVHWLLKTIYKVEVKGIENYKKAGKRVIIIANHTSFLDGLLIAAFLPDKLLFAINTYSAKLWWAKPILSLADIFPLDATNPMAIKTLIRLIQKNKRCLIFPEGRITVTGGLMKVYEGPGMVADKSDAMLLPINIEGPQYTCFSRLRGKVRMPWFPPKITLTILEPRKFEVEKDKTGRVRRNIIGMQLYDVMANMLFERNEYHNTLYQELLDAATLFGKRGDIAEDIERKPISYKQFIMRTIILGRHIAKSTEQGEYVGVLLPNMVTTAIVFFALQAVGRVPAMLNFSVGVHSLISACQTAQIKVIYTSRRFVETAKLEAIIEQIASLGIRVVFLEALQKEISFFARLNGLILSKFARYYHSRFVKDISTDHAAALLFTSGSEGEPKGVILSHKNILANSNQIKAVVDFTSSDIIFNALPMFHVFGLVCGSVLPMLSGVKSFFYPSPLHYRIVPELIYDSNATIMFGTDTFLAGYGRFAHPYDFYSIRYAFAGAEKLKPETRRLWSDKFGIRILEAYGVTEASPAVSINTPMHQKTGSVGRLLPGIEYRLEKIPGIEVGGRLYIKGYNIMRGYIMSVMPGVIQPPKANWHDTGDIVDVDEDGYLTIVGRAKRFAKIGGEMISLTAVENYIAEIWPAYHHAILSVPDDRKGERLILLTDCPDANRQAIIEHVKEKGLPEISIPREIKFTTELPLLATGKMDYVSAQKMVEQ